MSTSEDLQNINPVFKSKSFRLGGHKDMSKINKRFIFHGVDVTDKDKIKTGT